MAICWAKSLPAPRSTADRPPARPPHRPARRRFPHRPDARAAGPHRHPDASGPRCPLACASRRTGHALCPFHGLLRRGRGFQLSPLARRRHRLGQRARHRRAIATLYGQFIWPGTLSPDRQAALRTERARNDACPILGLPIRYGEGVELSTPPGLDFGPDPTTLGHWGAGGATGLAHPASGLSFGYVTGHMSPAMGSSRRARAYVAALFTAIPDLT